MKRSGLRRSSSARRCSKTSLVFRLPPRGVRKLSGVGGLTGQDDLHPLAAEDVIEGGLELGVAIAKHELGSQLTILQPPGQGSEPGEEPQGFLKRERKLSPAVDRVVEKCRNVILPRIAPAWRKEVSLLSGGR